MSEPFAETPAGYRLLLAHPTPWTYISDYQNGKSAIVDKESTLVVMEGQVDAAVYDAIWTLYFDHLQS